MILIRIIISYSLLLLFPDSQSYILLTKTRGFLNSVSNRKSNRNNSKIFSDVSNEPLDEAEDRKRKVRLLRSSTGRGTQECYDALKKAEGNVHVAKEILISSSISRNGNITNSSVDIVDLFEGRIALSTTLDLAAVIDLRCETDFVAKNKLFTNLSKSVANAALDAKQDSLSSGAAPSIQELIDAMLNKTCLKCNHPLRDSAVVVSGALKERIAISRIGFMQAQDGEVLIPYVHGSADPKGSVSVSGLSTSIVTMKIDLNGQRVPNDALLNTCRDDISNSPNNCCIDGNGCVFSNQLKVSNSEPTNNEETHEKIRKFIRKLTMHVVAEKPAAMTFDTYDKEGVDSMRKELEETLKGKPPEIIDKIILGKLRKSFGQHVLMEQIWTFGDGKSTVGQVLSKFQDELKCELKLKRFMHCGITDDLLSYKPPEGCEVYNTNVSF